MSSSTSKPDARKQPDLVTMAQMELDGEVIGPLKAVIPHVGSGADHSRRAGANWSSPRDSHMATFRAT
jgi:hypothetical protein